MKFHKKVTFYLSTNYEKKLIQIFNKVTTVILGRHTLWKTQLKLLKNNTVKTLFVSKKSKKNTKRTFDNYKGQKGELQEDRKKTFH